MRKLYCIIPILILSISLCSCTNQKMEEAEENMTATDNIGIEESSLINFHLYKSYAVDTSGFRKYFKVVEGTPLTLFFQVYTLDIWKEHSDFCEENFEFPEFDFEFDDYPDHYLAVSFGREVIEIKQIGETDYGDVETAITFAEEYHGDVMFLYIMDKIPLRLGMGSEFYLMNGSEKVFKGYSDIYLNETDMVRQGPNGAG